MGRNGEHRAKYFFAVWFFRTAWVLVQASPRPFGAPLASAWLVFDPVFSLDRLHSLERLRSTASLPPRTVGWTTEEDQAAARGTSGERPGERSVWRLGTSATLVVTGALLVVTSASLLVTLVSFLLK